MKRKKERKKERKTDEHNTGLYLYCRVYFFQFDLQQRVCAFFCFVFVCLFVFVAVFAVLFLFVVFYFLSLFQTT